MGHPTLLQMLFGDGTQVLTQNAKNGVHLSWRSVKRTVVQSLGKLFVSVLPEKPPGHTTVRECYSELLSAAKRGGEENRRLTPGFLWEQTIRSLAEKHGAKWKFEIMDKNGGQLCAHCLPLDISCSPRK